MDADTWASRLSSAKRRHSLQRSQQQQQWDRLTMDDFEPEDDVRPEFTCPYCYEDFDISSLCTHMEDEHPFESKGVYRQRFRRAGMPNGATLSLSGKELREAQLQVLLRNSGGSSSNNGDALLSALVYSFPTLEVEDSGKKNSNCEQNSTKKDTLSRQQKTSSEENLSDEEREQKLKQATLHAKFVQQLVLSTIMEDS